MSVGNGDGGDDQADPFMEMLRLTDEGRAALAKGRATDALKFLSEKHALVVSYWGEETIFAATSAVDLAEAHLACGDFEKADELFLWAIEKYSAMGVDDERLLRARSSSAMLAYQLAEYQVAESRFAELIDHYRKLGAEHDIERGMAMDHLAQVYLRQSKFDEAEVLLIEALAIFERDGSMPQATAVCLSILGGLYFSTRRYREAETLYRRAIALDEILSEEVGLAKNFDHLAMSLAMRAQAEGRAELAAEAVTFGETALKIFARHFPEDHRSIFASRSNLEKYRELSRTIGKMFPESDNDPEAEAAHVPESHPDAIVLSLGAARRHCANHDYARALELARGAYERAAKQFGTASPLADEAAAQVIAVLRRNCTYVLGEPTGTLSPVESMMMQMRAHVRRGCADDEGTPAPMLEPEQRVEVEDILTKAVEEMATLLSGDRAMFLFTSADFSSDALEIVHYARWIGVLDNDAATKMAFEIMQRHGDGPKAAALAASRPARKLQEEYRLASLDREALVRSLVEAKDRETASAAADRWTELPEFDRRIEELAHDLKEAGIDVDAAPATLSIDEAQSSLDPDEAIVAMHVGRRAIFLVAVKQDCTRLCRVEIEAELVEVMCRTLVSSATIDESGDLPPFDLLGALRLHDLLFHPLEDFLLMGSHLLLLPEGQLWTLPFACLIVRPMAEAGGEEEESLDDESSEYGGAETRRLRTHGFNEWLDSRSMIEALERVGEEEAWLSSYYSISLVPSLAQLADRKKERLGTDERGSFLGIGNPLIEAGSNHAIVPETGHILSGFAKAFGGDPASDVIIGKAATVERVVDLSESGELAKRRVLAFATHAIYPRGNGDLLTDAGLLFSDGEILSAFDIAGLRIDADFLLLTACFTGAPTGRTVTVPLSGLAQSFLQAGARSLLISHWPVDVEATEQLAQSLAQSIATFDRGLSMALGEAGRDVSRQGDTFLHPAYWAGFSVVGDGAVKLKR